MEVLSPCESLPHDFFIKKDTFCSTVQIRVKGQRLGFFSPIQACVHVKFIFCFISFWQDRGNFEWTMSNLGVPQNSIKLHAVHVLLTFKALLWRIYLYHLLSAYGTSIWVCSAQIEIPDALKDYTCEGSTSFQETPSNLTLPENLLKLSSKFKSSLFPPSVSSHLPALFQHMHEKQKKENHKSSPLHFIWIKSSWWIDCSKGSLSRVKSNSADTFGSRAPLTHCSWDTWTRLIKASEIWKTVSGL